MLPGSTLVGDGRLRVQRVHSDTRTLRDGDLFVALRGERFDAHDFLAQARSAGAVAALAERGIAEAGLSGLQVADALAALQLLAAAWRARFDAAADRRHRQQRQDHGDADGGVDPARRARRGGLCHRGQPEQPHRPAADAAAPERRAPRRRRRARHEPPRRDRAAGAVGRTDRRAGQQRAARAPGVHGHGGSRGARERRRHRGAARRRHGRLPGRRCLHTAVARDGRCAARIDLRAAGRGRGARRGALAGHALGDAPARPARQHRAGAAFGRAAQPEERARRRCLHAGRGCAAGRGGRAGSKPSSR